MLNLVVENIHSLPPFFGDKFFSCRRLKPALLCLMKTQISFIFFLLNSFSSGLIFSQNCQYLAYDGFDYQALMPLHGANGSTGWSGPWIVQGENIVDPGYKITNAAVSLNYGNLISSGIYAQGGDKYLTAGRRFDLSQDGPFKNYISQNENGIGILADGDTLWYSVVLNKNLDNNQPVFIDLHNDGNIPWCNNCANQHIAIGYFGPPSNAGNQKFWSLKINNSIYTSSKPVQINVNSFLVLRMIFKQTGTEIEYYINPSESGFGTLPVADISQVSNQNQVIRSMALYLGDQAQNGSVDEIRVSGQYACVAPDNSVMLDLPPVAVISSDQTSGKIPLTVNFNALNSYDPEGKPLTYTWNFGDGSTESSQGIVSHTYQDVTGQISVKLTVKDISDQATSAIQTIKLLNEFSTFNCNTTITSLNMAGCNADDGSIQVNAASDQQFKLTRDNVEIQPVMNNQFNELSPGNYKLTVAGTNGCKDTFNLQITEDKTTCQGWKPDSCSMLIGTNLSGFADWVPERPMKNLFKHVRPDPIPFTSNCFCWYLPSVSDSIDYDQEGYPLQIPKPTPEGPAMVRYIMSSNGANLPIGQQYVLLYEGAGEIQLQGNVTLLNNTPGRILFEVNDEGNIFFNLVKSVQGNHIRNIRILRPEDENADLVANPFYEGFLDKIKPFYALRFMDWGATNNNPQVKWSERAKVDYFTYGTHKGVPYEMMIKLANQLHKDVWICVPHKADDDFVAQMAGLFKEQLDSDLKIYLEYSNEVWNWIFDQSHYNVDTGPNNLGYGAAYAEKAKKVFRIWHEVFGEDKSRVQRVLGIQAGYNSLNEQILAQLDSNEWDLGSPTHYVGLDHGSSGNPVLTASSTPHDIIQNARNSFYSFKESVKRDYRTIELFGKRIVTYEGGQHFVGNVFGIPYDYQQAMWDAQYTPEIYQLYIELLDSIRYWGCELAMNFSLASPQESIYGSWGVLNDIDIKEPYLSTAPKYQALLDRLCEINSVNSFEILHPNTLFTIFPNPGSEAFSIRANDPSANISGLKLFDLHGKLLKEFEPGTSEIMVDLISGMYLISISSESGYDVQKLIIKK